MTSALYVLALLAYFVAVLALGRVFAWLDTLPEQPPLARVLERAKRDQRADLRRALREMRRRR